MRLGAVVLVVLVGQALAPVADAAPAVCDGRPAPSGGQSIEVGGARRSFIVRAPVEGDHRMSAPVVFAFHPFGMNAQYMASRAPIGRMWPQAFVVYPDGAPREGSGMAPSWQTRPGELGDRDLAFFDAMVSWLDERACVDRARLFVLGYSNGAGLAYTLACARASAVAGVAIAAGRLGCQPVSSKPVVMSHGLGDRTIGYEQAVDASKRWAAPNGCKAPPAAGARGCVQGQSCGGAPVTLCTHEGGHEYDPTFTRTVVEFFQAIAPSGPTPR